MIIKLDENGECIPDKFMEDTYSAKIDRRENIHIGSYNAFQCIRYLLHKMSIVERPEITWILYGKICHFDDNLRSIDAWYIDEMNLQEKWLGELLNIKTT